MANLKTEMANIPHASTGIIYVPVSPRLPKVSHTNQSTGLGAEQVQSSQPQIQRVNANPQSSASPLLAIKKVEVQLQQQQVVAMPGKEKKSSDFVVPDAVSANFTVRNIPGPDMDQLIIHGIKISQLPKTNATIKMTTIRIGTICDAITHKLQSAGYKRGCGTKALTKYILSRIENGIEGVKETTREGMKFKSYTYDEDSVDVIASRGVKREHSDKILAITAAGVAASSAGHLEFPSPQEDDRNPAPAKRPRPSSDNLPSIENKQPLHLLATLPVVPLTDEEERKQAAEAMVAFAIQKS